MSQIIYLSRTGYSDDNQSASIYIYTLYGCMNATFESGPKHYLW